MIYRRSSTTDLDHCQERYLKDLELLHLISTFYVSCIRRARLLWQNTMKFYAAVAEDIILFINCPTQDTIASFIH